MGPKTIRNIKTLFHALTVASSALAALGAFVPPKYAVLFALLTSAISGALNLLTRLYPDLVKEPVTE